MFNKFLIISSIMLLMLSLSSNFADAKSLYDSTQKEFADRGVNIKWYGAKGDGVTDDTSAFTSLITAIGADGADLFIPKGTYKITSNLTIPSNIAVSLAQGAVFSIGSGVTVTIAAPIKSGIVTKTGNGNVISISDDFMINVKNFGAHSTTESGFGTFDSTTAIQNAINYASTIISSNTLLPTAGPTRDMGQVVLFFPAGKYLITSSLDCYGGITLKGASRESTVIQLKSDITSPVDAMISLHGTTYSTIKLCRNFHMEDISLNSMYKANFTVTNVLGTSGDNSLDSCVFENIFLANAINCNLFIGGGWSNSFYDVSLLNAKVNGIFTTNVNGNGFNNNTFINLNAQSANLTGIYFNGQNCTFTAMNIDKVGKSTWYNGGYDIAKGFTYNGVTYTKGFPVGMIVTGISKNLRVTDPWLEYVQGTTETGTTGHCFYVCDGESYPNGQMKLTGIVLDGVHIGADVDNVFKISSGDVTIISPSVTNAASVYEYTTGNNVFVLMDRWYFYDLSRGICYDTLNNVSSDHLTRFKAINIRSLGGYMFDKYNDTKFTDGYTFAELFTNGTTSQTIREKFDYNNSDYIREVNKKINNVNTSKKSVVISTTDTQLGQVSLPSNVIDITVSNGINTVTVPFSMSIKTKDTSGKFCVLLTATSAAASQLLAGGYYITNILDNSFDIVFNNTATSPCAFNCLIITNGGY